MTGEAEKHTSKVKNIQKKFNFKRKMIIKTLNERAECEGSLSLSLYFLKSVNWLWIGLYFLLEELKVLLVFLWVLSVIVAQQYFMRENQFPKKFYWNFFLKFRTIQSTGNVTQVSRVWESLHDFKLFLHLPYNNVKR